MKPDPGFSRGGVVRSIVIDTPYREEGGGGEGKDEGRKRGGKRG